MSVQRLRGSTNSLLSTSHQCYVKQLNFTYKMLVLAGRKGSTEFCAERLKWLSEESWDSSESWDLN